MVYRRNSQFKFILLIINNLSVKKGDLLALKPIDFQGTEF